MALGTFSCERLHWLLLWLVAAWGGGQAAAALTQSDVTLAAAFIGACTD